MPKINLHFQRFEFKYYLPKNKADKLIPALLNHMNWDPYIKNSPKDHYEVNSLYFDSPDYGCFFDKEAGLADRKKLRYRFYNDLEIDNPVFLEIKRKKDALVIKDRISLHQDSCNYLKLNDILKKIKKENKNNYFVNEVIWFKNRNSLKPKLFVCYKRKAFVGKLDPKLRITFDYDIKTQLSNDLKLNNKKWHRVYPQGAVIEVKYNNILPSWFHKIIQRYQLNRIAYSKYCNALRHCLPKFDDNNYAPY
ncbi:MAG: polyphosphate polymerase domain-containing protein [Candidatus Kuenenbacteria bacterium]